MKAINWVRWLLAAGVCASIWPRTLAIARHKFRHPQPQIYKKSWPVGPRISMGNSLHMNLGPSGYKHGRPMQHKPTNYRYPPQNPIRRPPMFAVLPSWKQQSMMGPLPVPNQGSHPQRGPMKEFHTMNKAAEYRPEQSIPMPTNRGNLDDDKGPIHTIPAPNLSPADKPYNMPSQSYSQNSEYTQTFLASPQSSATNYAFGTQGTSLAPQRITTGPTSPSPTLHRYEVTETNEIGVQDYRTSVQPNFFTPEFDVTRLSNFPTTGGQTNDGFGNQPSASNSGIIGTSIQFGQQNSPAMQTNLHSSLHVGFPASAGQAQQNSAGDQQSPDLHVGHPAPAGPPLSANQLYDLLNSFPQQFNDQYTIGQQQQHQQQQQQQVLQQQLDQIFQQTSDVQFSQPQMHSFNYDEQSNKQQQQQRQQQVFVGQDYASGRVTADYSLKPDGRESSRKPNIPRQETSGVSVYPSDNSENNIEYEETSNRKGLSTYFNQVGDDGSFSSQFYTTLPNRDAAEKLAALAAAGNVNSHLIGQLRKQQTSNPQLGGTGLMPSNHKDERYGEAEQQHPRYVHRNRDEEDQSQKNEQEGEAHREQKEEKRPLRIMVPDLEDYSEDLDQRPSRGDNDSIRGTREDYEYEDAEESQISESEEDSGRQQASGDSGSQGVYRQQLESEFGSRLGAKSK